MKQNIAVIYGGKTVEHDISVITGIQAVNNASDEFNIIPVYIDNDGIWHTGKNLKDISIYSDFKNKAKTFNVAFLPFSDMLYKRKGKSFKPYIKIDCAVLAMHGMNGEDGTLQGLLSLNGIPFTSSDCLGAACAMDKVVMKMIFQSCGLPVLPYKWFLREEFLRDGESILSSAEKEIGFPIIVKPSNLGSSIGISVCSTHEELKNAVEVACVYDGRIILEKALTDFKEVNCSALGTSDSVQASECEEPVNWHKFLTFSDKYMAQGKSKGMSNLKRKFPADIPAETKNDIQSMTKTVFRAFECKGVVRVDYLLDNKTQKTYINEINTIPGSFAFYLWEKDGLDFKKLITKLVDIARIAKEHKDKNNYAYKSDVLKGFGGAKK